MSCNLKEQKPSSAISPPPNHLSQPSPLTSQLPIPSSKSNPSPPNHSQVPKDPDHGSLVLESFAQGLPPVHVAPSVEHLHAGDLGEVTKGWGSDLTKPPHSPPPHLPEPTGSTREWEEQSSETTPDNPDKRLNISKEVKMTSKNKKKRKDNSVGRFISEEIRKYYKNKDSNSSNTEDTISKISTDNIKENECEISEQGMCVVHNCETRKVEIIVLKWCWILEKKKFDYVRERIVKQHCTPKNSVPTAPNIVPTVPMFSLTPDLYSVGTSSGEGLITRGDLCTDYGKSGRESSECTLGLDN